MMRLHFLLGLSLLLTAIPAAAQVTTGGIEGYVLTADSTPLRDVEILVSGPALPGLRLARTDAVGRFLVTLLPPGNYRVLVRWIGYRPVAYEAVPVRLATTVRIPATSLVVSPVELEPITVEASRITLDFQGTAVQTTLDAEALDALPVEREFTAAAGLAPGANTSFYGDGVNFSGGTGTENTWYVDGLNVTNPLTGAPGLRLPSYMLEQVEVRSGVYEASLGQGLGTVINAVTPTGGNDLSLRGYGFLARDGFSAESRGGPGALRGFTEFDGGVGVGGPLRHDRLWFFAAYNPLIATRDLEIAGVPLQRARQEQHAFAGKLTWRPGPATSVDLALLGDPAMYREVAIVDSALSPHPLLTTRRTGGLNLALRASRRLGSSVLLEVTGQRYHSRDDFEGATAAGRSQARFLDVTSGTGVVSGGVGMRQELRGTRWTVGAQALVLVPRHTIRVGAEFERTIGRTLFEALPTGSGGFITNDAVGSWGSFYFLAEGTVTNSAPSLFLQDAWQFHPRWLVTAGLRWERQRLRAPGGESRIDLTSGLQPRLGLIYQPGRPGTTKLYASYGRFVERTSLWLAAIMGSAWFGGGPADHDPRTDPPPTVTLISQTGSFEFKSQAVHELSAGLEQRLVEGMIAGVRGVARDLEWVVEDGGDGVIYTLGNPGRGQLAGLPRARRSYRALEVTLRNDGGPTTILASYILSRTRGNYTGLYATDMDLPAPHTGPQFDTPEQLVNGTGLLPNDRPHQFRLVATRRLRSRLGVGGVFWLATGTPISEQGLTPGSGYITFLSPRGSAGRTPTIVDLDLRLTWDLITRGRMRGTLLLDLLHLPNSRTAVELEQQAALVTFGRPIAYQPARRARVGLRLEF